MGIPKLFKYITERYPSLCQTVTANQVHLIIFFSIKWNQPSEYFAYHNFFGDYLCLFQLPQYDYFYIDLNHLIHKALSEKCHLPLEEVDDKFLTEARIVERVLRYIETLHRIVPSKVLFLSTDGVAPRAKWATQRNRRFEAFCVSNYFW